MILRVPEPVLSALFSPNLMRTLINQSKKEDRYLHSAAVAALKSIQAKAQQEAASALPIFVMLTTTNGCVDFDRVTKTKTLEQLLLSADDSTLKKMVRHLNSLILRPGTDEQAAADIRRQVIADLLLNTVKHYKQYRDLPADAAEQDGWLKKTLEVLIEYAYFVPSQSAKTSKVPLPLVSEGNRQMFQERLSSCLTRLLDVGGGSRSTFAASIVSMIKSKTSSSKSLDLAFRADDSVKETVEKASQTLDAILAKVCALSTLSGDFTNSYI
jgi:DNA polymerase phi